MLSLSVERFFGLWQLIVNILKTIYCFYTLSDEVGAGMRRHPVRPSVRVSFPEQILETHGDLFYIAHTHSLIWGVDRCTFRGL